MLDSWGFFIHIEPMKRKLFAPSAIVFIVLPLLFIWTTPANAGDPLKGVAVKLAKPLKKLKDPKIGLLIFPYHDGKISSGSSIVSERLTTSMAEIKGIRVIERRLIQKLLQEQKLSESGAIDQRTASQIGKILGVNVIVTGTLIDLDDDKTEVNARGLSIETGEVISAGAATIQRSWADRPKFPQALRPKEPPRVEPEKKVDDEPIEIGYPGRGRGFRR